MGREESLEFIKDVIHIGERDDCTAGDIMENIGVKLGICYECVEYKDVKNPHSPCDTCCDFED